ncbi:MAG TPA: hypothetical protein VG737_11310 [Cyclobacteriaceae bacterium]|nr:hypothetical protein [Cyclobacteriaceae bacterium]
MQDTLDFHYQMTKGRLAETIIEEMFVDHEYEVHRFGMENMVPGIVRTLRRNASPVSIHIKQMPDFVIKKDDNIHFVEVKFSSRGEFNYAKLLMDNKTYPYDNCLLIVVSPDAMKALSLKELSDGISISPKCNNHLIGRPEFKLNPALVAEYQKMVKIFFAGAPSRWMA